MQAHGVYGLPVRKGGRIAVRVGKSVVNDRERGLAGVRSQIQNIPIKLLLFGRCDRDVPGIDNKVSRFIGDVVVVGIKLSITGLTGDTDFVPISRRASGGRTVHSGVGNQSHRVYGVAIGKSAI